MNTAPATAHDAPVTAPDGSPLPPAGALCWDGRDYTGAEPDACTLRATRTVPRSVWAPNNGPDTYPDDVPACDGCARDVWRSDVMAAVRAESSYTGNR